MGARNDTPPMSDIQNSIYKPQYPDLATASSSRFSRPIVAPLSPAVVRNSNGKHTSQTPLSPTSANAPLSSPSSASTISRSGSRASIAPNQPIRESLAHSPKQLPHSPSIVPIGHRQDVEKYGNNRAVSQPSPMGDVQRTTVQYEDEEPEPDIVQEKALRLTVRDL
ncbi:MAG: hypothetical protein M1820_008714 [Bogoriella megaspora]|nr:MAG: hypothetical protein M1820_008714 [Bogoriella megaspora]